MFGHNYDGSRAPRSPEHALQAILREYAEIAGCDPLLLREKISAKEIWRFFVRGEDQKNDGWVAWEKKERKYLALMYEAFDEIFDSSSPVEVMLQCHAKAAPAIVRTALIGEFRGERNIHGGFTIQDGGANATVAGILQALRARAQENSLRYFALNMRNYEFSDYDDVILSKDIVDVLRKFVSMNVDADYHSAPVYTDLLKTILPFISRKLFAAFFQKISKDHAFNFVDMLVAIGKTTDDESLAHCYFNLPVKAKEGVFNFTFVSKQPENTTATITAEVNALIESYEANIATTKQPMDALRAIVRLVQSLKQLCPFLHANTQTVGNLFLNYLLIKQKMPLAMLEKFGCVDMYSEDELIDEVIKAMQNTFALIRTGKLYGKSSDEILEQLKKPSSSEGRSERRARNKLEFLHRAAASQPECLSARALGLLEYFERVTTNEVEALKARQNERNLYANVKH